MGNYTCLNCGKEFNAKNKRKFCSKECYLTFIKTRFKELKKPVERKLVKVVCAECGKVEYVIPCRAQRYKCCSVECLGKYNSKKYSQKITLTCPICGDNYSCKQSTISRHRTCGKTNCRHEWLSKTRKGKGNANFKDVSTILKEMSTTNIDNTKMYHNSKLYQHIVKEQLHLNSVRELPKGYVIHHKDANHFNNAPTNLVMLPKTVHRQIHTIFGNILIQGIHTSAITQDMFFKICTEEQKNFYKEIIDLNITHQVVVKQGELLENPEEDNQQPSIYRNIYEGSTTNSRVLTSKVEDSNTDTSALPIINNGDEIV